MSAEAYRRRALQQAEFIRVFLPVVLTVGIGGSVVLAYALTRLRAVCGLAPFPGKACKSPWSNSAGPSSTSGRPLSTEEAAELAAESPT